MKGLFFLVCVFFCSSLFASQLVQWDKRPISVVLPVGKERIIQLPDNVLVGVPASIKPLLRVQSAQGLIYLTARQSFSQSRVQLKLHSTGEIILLDISAINNDELTQEDIVITLSKNNQKTPSELKTNSSSTMSKRQVTPIELTQFATRTFYAPERLALNDKRIRVTKAPTLDLSRLFTGNSFQVFDAKAQALFRAGNLYLTAIKLVNNTHTQQTITFTDIDADFLYATPQHLQVNKKNVPGDTTMLYLITKKPLAAALYNPVNTGLFKG